VPCAGQARSRASSWGRAAGRVPPAVICARAAGGGARPVSGACGSRSRLRIKSTAWRRARARAPRPCERRVGRDAPHEGAAGRVPTLVPRVIGGGEQYNIFWRQDAAPSTPTIGGAVDVLASWFAHAAPLCTLMYRSMALLNVHWHAWSLWHALGSCTHARTCAADAAAPAPSAPRARRSERQRSRREAGASPCPPGPAPRRGAAPGPQLLRACSGREQRAARGGAREAAGPQKSIASAMARAGTTLGRS
jgi:hypothetical protein